MHQDLFELLKKDHRELMEMLDQLKETTDRASKKREELFMQMKQEIVPHMRAEEKAFYSVLQKNEEAKEDAMEAIEEHHAAESVMGELDKMPKQEEFWHAKLSVFKEMIKHHIEEEEGKVFKDAEKVISEDQMKKILENFKNEKERIKEQSLARSR
jgi:hemerythrin-like domain-containing protein